MMPMERWLPGTAEPEALQQTARLALLSSWRCRSSLGSSWKRERVRSRYSSSITRKKSQPKTSPMAWKRTYKCFRCCAAAALAMVRLPAAEHHGMVKFGGLPVPGASITATQNGRKLWTITDPQGVYSFLDLADGTWIIQVEMQLFLTER